jgi:hypothetical protein
MVSLTQPPSGALSESECVRLRELECIVQEGLDSFLQVGAALSEIRVVRLYRTTHARFEDYCLDRFGLSLSRCNQLILSTRTYDNLVAAIPQDAALLSEANEHALRPLNSLDPQLQIVTWELIKRIEERPAGITIQKVVARIKEAIASGWEERNSTVADTDPAGRNEAATVRPGRSRRLPERQSDRLASFCKWAAQVHLWDPESIAATDDPLCARRHLKVTRQLRTFCDHFIVALEIRLSRATSLANI